MKHPFVIFAGTASWPASFRLMAAGMLFMAAVASAQAQTPPPGGGGPRQGPPPPPPTAGAHLDIVDGSSASYRVTEQFVGINFPSDAVGISSTVAGTVGIAADGSIVPGSKLTIDLRNLESDQEQRDGYVRNKTRDREISHG